MKFAPIVLFVYNRPLHTLRTLEALSENREAENSVLYIYADGAKAEATTEELESIQQTREIIRSRKWCRENHIIESEKNIGLANSVIKGTTEIVHQYGKVITLEDDIIVSTHFLEYMNKALELYRDDENVFMVSGYNFPVEKFHSRHSSFFMPVSTTQAWGTWKRAWDQFDSNASGYEKLKTSASFRQKFNLDDSYDYSGMLIDQMETDKYSSWAIRFWWTLFNKKGLVLFPDRSLIQNIGWDGSGVHSGLDNPFIDLAWDKNYRITNFPSKGSASIKNYEKLKSYLRQTVGLMKPKKSDRYLSKLIRQLKTLVKKNGC